MSVRKILQNDPLSHGATVGRSVLTCQMTDPIWRNATRGFRVIVWPPRMRTVNYPRFHYLGLGWGHYTHGLDLSILEFKFEF